MRQLQIFDIFQYDWLKSLLLANLANFHLVISKPQNRMNLIDEITDELAKWTLDMCQQLDIM